MMYKKFVTRMPFYLHWCILNDQDICSEAFRNHAITQPVRNKVANIMRVGNHITTSTLRSLILEISSVDFFCFDFDH